MAYKSELEFAIETAQKAGSLLMENFGKQNEPQWTAETKETNFKIVMDKKSDALIRGRILQYFPKDDIYSEEAEDVDRGRKRKWVFDPLDGTIPYTTHQNDNWSVAIALVNDRTPILGVVYIPQREELYSAVIGEGAFCNGIPIRVSFEDTMNKAMIGLDGGKIIQGWYDPDSLKVLEDKIKVGRGAGHIFATGCASVPLCQVASGTPDTRLPRVGRIQAYIGGALEPYDMVAQVPIIIEAGGRVTHLSGKEWQLSKLFKGDPTILAANPNLHQKFRAHLAEAIDIYYSLNGFAQYK